MSFLSFMATEDNTLVTVTLPNGINTLSGQTGTINVGPLNRGQSYVIAVENSTNGIIGSLIESTKPIVVNSGQVLDHLQLESLVVKILVLINLLGAELVGSEYIFVKGNGNNSWENVLLIADQNNTEININGSPYTIKWKPNHFE